MTLPAWVNPLLERIGGKNPYGQPNYRIVWSEDRMEWRFDEHKRKYGDGRDRWVLEKWVAPQEYGSRQEWEACVEPVTYLPILGPYPENGDYEHCFTFEVTVNPGEEPTFMPLAEGVVEVLLKAIEAGKLNHTAWERKAAIQQRMDDAKAEQKRIFDDLWRDAAPAPGAKIPDHILQMDSTHAKTTADLSPNLPSRGFKQLGDN